MRKTQKEDLIRNLKNIVIKRKKHLKRKIEKTYQYALNVKK